MHKRRQKGIALTETLVALAIGAVMVALTANAVSALMRNSQAEQIKNNVKILLTAGQGFYEAYCQVIPVSARPSPSINRLVNEGFLPNANAANNPWGDDMWVSIIWGNASERTRVRVLAPMDSQYSVHYLYRVLGSDRISATHRAIWEASPEVFSRPGGASLIGHLRLHYEDDTEVCR
ncbi:type II secretion system protein [Marinimicrobium sp. ABcell2]|uniref:type II secretion system protein n=1 Tax=Marinimicrobium sp. ABcell2 TaxID=3069751 RepID=UPI0027AF9AC2|nr:type II secretion system protein [Marinimicrobium sp. ABcell2]MDQ2077383.1 type II secretion system protein [Marinimicrobium sp. ABcell2]